MVASPSPARACRHQGEIVQNEDRLASPIGDLLCECGESLTRGLDRVEHRRNVWENGAHKRSRLVVDKIRAAARTSTRLGGPAAGLLVGPGRAGATVAERQSRACGWAPEGPSWWPGPGHAQGPGLLARTGSRPSRMCPLAGLPNKLKRPAQCTGRRSPSSPARRTGKRVCHKAGLRGQLEGGGTLAYVPAPASKLSGPYRPA